MLKTKQINEEIVKPVKIPKLNPDNIKGYDIIPEIFSNIFICAKKKSGKTSSLFKVIKECCSKDTHLIGFISTHEKDPTWIEIKKWLETKKIPATFFSSLIDGDTDNLEMLVEVLKTEKPEEQIIKEAEEQEAMPKVCCFEDDSEKLKFKIKKPKKQVCKYMIIFDDVSQELKNKNLSYLLKTNRHHKSKVIISSQYIHDLAIDARQQLDNYILFGGHSKDKLETFYKHMDLPIEMDEFLNMYYDATKEKYNFLYVDCSGKFRKNFDQEYLINK